MVEPMFHKEKIMTIGNILREIRKSVNKKSQMSLRDMLVLAPLYLMDTRKGHPFKTTLIKEGDAMCTMLSASLLRQSYQARRKSSCQETPTGRD